MPYDYGHYTNDAYLLLRGLNKADDTSDSTKDTPVIDLADDAAQNQNNKSGITVALEDFSEKFKNFHGYDNSNITAKDAKKGFFSRKTDNIFESSEGQEVLKDHGNLFQKDIFADEVNKYGGIQYGDGNLADSALAFAQADIQAIEKAYYKCHDGKADGTLTLAEIKSYVNMDNFDIEQALKNMDIDDDEESITAEEYASYMMAADGLAHIQTEYGIDEINYNSARRDGLVSADEAQLAKEDNHLDEDALSIYQQYFKD